MVKLAKVLTGFTMALLVFLLVALYGVSLQTRLSRFEAEPGTQNEGMVVERLDTARRSEMGSDLFKRPTSTDAAHYQLIHIAVEARNVGILPAEWIQLRVAPEAGDVALFAGEATDIRPLGGTRTLEVTLLCEAGADTARRDIRLSYYIFGRRLEVAVH